MLKFQKTIYKEGKSPGIVKRPGWNLVGAAEAVKQHNLNSKFHLALASSGRMTRISLNAGIPWQTVGFLMMEYNQL